MYNYVIIKFNLTIVLTEFVQTYGIPCSYILNFHLICQMAVAFLCLFYSGPGEDFGLSNRNSFWSAFPIFDKFPISAAAAPLPLIILEIILIFFCAQFHKNWTSRKMDSCLEEIMFSYWESVFPGFLRNCDLIPNPTPFLKFGLAANQGRFPWGHLERARAPGLVVWSIQRERECRLISEPCAPPKQKY